jgi:hypothetical protein
MVETMRPSTLESPEDQSGAVVGSQTILGRSDHAAIVLHTLVGFPDGILVDVGAHIREPLGSRSWIDEIRDENRPDRFRIGFAFDEPIDPVPLGIPVAAHEPVWYLDGGSGSDLTYRVRLWISPYPPSGLLTVSASWEAKDIDMGWTKLIVPTPEEIDSRTLKLWS